MAELRSVDPRITAGNGEDGDVALPARARPDVTQKGVAIIGDLRTDALHQALAEGPIEDETLLGLLVLAFGCNNVAVDSGSGQGKADRRTICQAIAEGGALTADLDLVRQSARLRVPRLSAGARIVFPEGRIMTHLASDALDAAQPPPTVPPLPATCHPLSREVLEWQIALRRSRLGELEAAYGPRMRHLRRQIVQLERLAALGIGA